MKFANSSDIFEKLNVWSLSTQGSVSDIFLYSKENDGHKDHKKRNTKNNCEPFERNIFAR